MARCWCPVCFPGPEWCLVLSRCLGPWLVILVQLESMLMYMNHVATKTTGILKFLDSICGHFVVQGSWHHWWMLILVDCAAPRVDDFIWLQQMAGNMSVSTALLQSEPVLMHVVAVTTKEHADTRALCCLLVPCRYPRVTMPIWVVCPATWSYDIWAQGATRNYIWFHGPTTSEACVHTCVSW